MDEKKLNTEIINSVIDLGLSMRREIIRVTKSVSELTILQIQILMFIYNNKKNKNSEIARFFHTNKSTASIHLKKLEEMKLVRREQDPKDRRIDWISLTKKGFKSIDKRIKEKNKHANQLLGLIPQSDRQQLFMILKKIKKVFEQTYETK
jgi:DNA-binding MarR family transcriptional regulator